MTLQGTLRRLGNNWIIEHKSTIQDTPVWRITTWQVIDVSRRTPYGPAPDMSDGLTVEAVRDRDAWQAHEHGNYLILETNHVGTAREEPYPCPKVRNGIETRYQSGAWQKYLKTKGWIVV